MQIFHMLGGGGGGLTNIWKIPFCFLHLLFKSFYYIHIHYRWTMLVVKSLMHLKKDTIFTVTFIMIISLDVLDILEAEVFWKTFSQVEWKNQIDSSWQTDFCEKLIFTFIKSHYIYPLAAITYFTAVHEQWIWEAT